jgi:hypothetical protein
MVHFKNAQRIGPGRLTVGKSLKTSPKNDVLVHSGNNSFVKRVLGITATKYHMGTEGRSKRVLITSVRLKV